jgi:hypothetical protein
MRHSVLCLACWLAAGLSCSGAAAAQRPNAAPTAPTGGLGGDIDPVAVRSVIRAHADEVRRCYEAYLTAHPDAAGQVALKWIIGADGNVRDPILLREKTTLPGNEVPECVAERLKTWQFPQPRNGGIAIITYPWIMRPPRQPPRVAPQ